MKRRVLLLPQAKDDLDRLVEFLVDKASPTTAEQAVDAIVAAVLSLSEFSERGRKGRHPGVMELGVHWGRHGYVIQYRVEPSVVLVSRIFHGRERR